MPFVAWFGAPARAWTGWAVDAAVLAYAAWSVVCHAVMLLGGSTHALNWTVFALGCAALLAIGGYGGLRYRRARGAAPGAAAAAASTSTSTSTSTSAPQLAPEPAVGEGLAPRAWIALGVAALGVLALWLTDAGYLWKWIALCAYLLLAAALSLFPYASVAPPPARPARWQELAIWTLALAGGWLSLYVQRWRNDDCFYVNLAVTVADWPHAALMSINTVHGPIADGRMHAVYAPYRVHSFEALGGYLSFLTGIPAVEVIHLGLGTVGAMLLPLALARLFAALDPRRWFVMVLAALLIYLFEGSSGLGYGNHGFIRSFTGKSLMLSVALPLLVHNAIAFARAPSAYRWLLLLAAQICALGLSSTALWLAPLAAMLATMVPLRFERAYLRAFLLALLSCGYVLALAFWVRGQLMPSSDASMDADDAAAAAAATTGAGLSADFGLLYWWLKKMFADIPVADHYLSLIVVAIAASRTHALRRYLVIFCAALAFFLMNPYLGDFVRFNITGKWTGERVLFLLPLPAVVAGAFCALLPSRRGWLRNGLAVTAVALGLALFFRFVPTKPVYQAGGDTTFQWPPRPKVPVIEYAVGEYLTSLPLGNRLVLAPEVVSWFLPTIHRHPFPVAANVKYLEASKGEKKRRKKLVELVSRYRPSLNSKERRELRNSFERYDLGAIVVTRAATRSEGVLELLQAGGFQRRPGPHNYGIWFKPAP